MNCHSEPRIQGRHVGPEPRLVVPRLVVLRLAVPRLVNRCFQFGDLVKSVMLKAMCLIPLCGIVSCVSSPAVSHPSHPEERHLQNIRQITFGGENAEAYVADDGQRLVFQSTRDEHECDQIFTMNLDGSDVELISPGTGRTTCAFFAYPGDASIVFSSTHEADAQCPPKPDRSQGYVWPIYPSYEIYTYDMDSGSLEPLTANNAYDAEATYDLSGSNRIVFTSNRDGDLDIYSMEADGTDVKRLTNTPGYDGGPFYSWDGKKIVYRGLHSTGDKLADYQRLLKQNLVRPSNMELFIMNADGTGSKQLTTNGAANFAPFFHPDGKRIIFASNLGDRQDDGRYGREFDLWMIGVDGSGLERITYQKDFDGFPMFTRDGKTLVWCSNRHNAKRGETNVFVADWVD